MELGKPPTTASACSCCDQAEYEARGEVGYIQPECRVLSTLCPTLDLCEPRSGVQSLIRRKSTKKKLDVCSNGGLGVLVRQQFPLMGRFCCFLRTERLPQGFRGNDSDTVNKDKWRRSGFLPYLEVN